MSMLVPNAGEVLVLEMIVNKTAAQNLVLKLFQSNTTPAETDTAATYTEADFSGYAAATLTGASWGSGSAGAPSSITYGSAQSFTADTSVSNDIYGYFYVQATSGTILAAERDASAPFAVRNSGDKVQLTPAITCD